jgi:hypothetical protein
MNPDDGIKETVKPPRAACQIGVGTTPMNEAMTRDPAGF